jgi:hypothetical protein
MRDLFGLKLIRFLLVPRRNDIELFNQFTDIRNQNGILLNIVVGIRTKRSVIYVVLNNYNFSNICICVNLNFISHIETQSSVLTLMNFACFIDNYQ